MANLLMNPVVPGFTSDAFASKGKMVSQQEGASFATFIEKKSAEFDIGKNMLGVKGDNSSSSVAVQAKGDSPDETVASSLAELLQQFMAKLNELADSKEIGAGKWQLTGLDTLTIEKLTEKAGMGAVEQATLTTKRGDGGTTLGLVDFFSALENNFSQLDRPEPVTALETSLPLLQTILSKLGVSESDIVRISDASVDDVGGFDLSIFLNGLNGIEEPGQLANIPQKPETAIPLTSWETEQLQDMLETAGLTKETELQLFPEKTAAMFNAINGLEETKKSSSQTVMMDLSRLKSLLHQTLSDAESSQPKVDLPAFLGELKKVLAQADFKDGGVSWSPVLQNTISSVFEELQKIVDLSKVKIEYCSGGHEASLDKTTWSAVATSTVAIADDGAGNYQSVPEIQRPDAESDPLFTRVVVDEGVLDLKSAGKKVDIAGQIIPGADTQLNTVLETIGTSTVTGKEATNPSAVSDIGDLEIEGEIGSLRKDAFKGEEIIAGPKEAIQGGKKSTAVNPTSKMNVNMSSNTSKENLQQKAMVSTSHEVNTVLETISTSTVTGKESTNPSVVSVVGDTEIAGEIGSLRKDAFKGEEIVAGPKEAILGAEKSTVVNQASKMNEDFSSNTPKENLQQKAMFAMSHVAAGIQYDNVAVKEAALAHSQARSPLQQRPLEQISTGVLRGLRESQHQLTLTLHPKELGEVKVDMIVRDNHVSLSFLMETHKVKGLIESNMQEFRQNMAQNGFQLEGCSVSVDQNNDSELQGHQFAEGGQGMNERARKAGLAEVNDIVAAGLKLRSSYHDGKISVIA